MESSSVAATIAAKAWPARHIVITVEGRDGSRAEIKVDKPFARIGRDRRAEVPLNDTAVLPCHAYLHATHEGIYCVGLAAGAPNGWLLPSASLEVGGFRLHAAFEQGKQSPPTLPEPQSKNSATPPFPRLRVFSDKIDAGYTDVTIHRQLTIVGRQAPAAWRVKHPTISRAHCALVWDGEQFWLIDLFSSNGTRVGGKRFDSGTVPVGQEFRLGMVRLCYLGCDPVLPASPHGLAPDHASGQSDVTDLSVAAPTAGDQPLTIGAETPQHHASLADRRLDPPEPPATGMHEPLAAALVDTRLPSTGDTKFVEPASRTPPSPSPQPPPRDSHVAVQQAAPVWENLERELAGERRARELKLASLEEKLSAIAADSASQRDAVASDLARAAAELAAARQEIARLDEELRHERQASAERLASLELGSEQRWESRLAELADQVRKECERFERQAQIDHEARGEQFAALRDNIAAEGAELAAAKRAVSDELRTLAAELAETQATMAALQAEASRQREVPQPEHPEQSEVPAAWYAQAQELTQQIERRGEDLQAQIVRLETELADETEQTREAIEQQLRRQRRTEDHLVELAKEIDRQVVAIERRLAQRRSSDTDAAAAAPRERDELERRLLAVEQGWQEQLNSLKTELLGQVDDLHQQADLLRQEYRQQLQLLADGSTKTQEMLGLCQAEFSRSQELLAADLRKGFQDAEQRWETRFGELAEEISKGAGELERRSGLELQDDREQLAALEGSLTAKIAELRARQDELRQQLHESLKPERAPRYTTLELTDVDAPHAEQSAADAETDRAASMTSGPTEEVPGEGRAVPGDHDSSPRQPIVVSYADDDPLANSSPQAILPDMETDLTPLPLDLANPEAATTPDWVINDELTQRLINFRTKRERTAWQRRLLWTAVAVALVGLIMAAAGIARYWMNEKAAGPNATEGPNALGPNALSAPADAR